METWLSLSSDLSSRELSYPNTNLNQHASKPALIQFVQAGHQIVKNNKPIQFNFTYQHKWLEIIS